MKRSIRRLVALSTLAALSTGCGSSSDPLFAGNPSDSGEELAVEGGAGSGHDAGLETGPDAKADAAEPDSEAAEDASQDQKQTDAEAGPDADASNSDASTEPDADASSEPDVDGGCVPGGPALGSVGAACCTPNDLACAGHAQKLVLYCDPISMKWTALQSCNGSQLCDTAPGSNHGSCQDPLPECVGKSQGDKVCLGSKLLECGPDLLTATSTDCEFACYAGACTGTCVPASESCDGNVPRTCDETGTWQDGAPCPFVCAAGQCSGSCVPGSKQCAGKTPQTCTSSGDWQSSAECPFVCSAGECTGACVPGTRQCGGKTVLLCDGGGAWQTATDCPYVCNAGQCTGVCDPGSMRCSSTVPQTCDALGQWQSGTACPYLCSAGACTGHCVPGSRQCNGASTQVCTASGEWQSETTCPYVCFNGLCGGSCSPGTKHCNGSVPQTCGDNGTWQGSTPCAFVCSSGQCIGQCAPGAKRCDGLMPQTCDSNGEWQNGTTCSYLCSSGTCTGSCVPGSRRCNGSATQVCSAQANWTTETLCPYVCADAKCSGVCVPGTTQCNGDSLWTCKADGQWDGGVPCSGQTPKCFNNQCSPVARPYFMVVTDTSGSMNVCTTPATTFPSSCPVVSSSSPDNTCGLRPTRMNDAKCALRRTLQAFAQADFGLTSFTQTVTGCGASPYACAPYQVDGLMPEFANACAITTTCQTGTGDLAHGGTVRVGLPVSTNTQTQFLAWINDDCGSGTELVPAGPTPINGALRDAAAHLRSNAALLTPATLRVNVLLLTDGGESCDGTEVENRAALAAQELYLYGLNDGSGRHVMVYPVGLGAIQPAEKTALDNIAKMGQCGSTTDVCASAISAPVAANEAELTARIATIVNANLP